MFHNSEHRQAQTGIVENASPIFQCENGQLPIYTVSTHGNRRRCEPPLCNMRTGNSLTQRQYQWQSSNVRTPFFNVLTGSYPSTPSIQMTIVESVNPCLVDIHRLAPDLLHQLLVPGWCSHFGVGPLITTADGLHTELGH